MPGLLLLATGGSPALHIGSLSALARAAIPDEGQECRFLRQGRYWRASTQILIVKPGREVPPGQRAPLLAPCQLSVGAVKA